jgi:hypothetical protein
MSPRRLLLAGCLAAALLAAPSIASAAPDVHASCSPGPADCMAWYRQATTITWTLDAGLAPVAGCATQTVNPDAVVVSSCKAAPPDHPLQTVSRDQPVQVDQTPPVPLAPNPARLPDAGGWYRAPVQVAFAAKDNLSQLSFCTSPVYAGPDSGATVLTGSCTDVAGNAAATSYPLRYDSTPPRIRRMVVKRKPDHGRWYNRPVVARFKAADKLSGVAQCPPVLVAGAPASRARPVVGTCTDVAGNVATRTFALPFDATPPAKPVVGVKTGDRVVRLGVQVDADTARIRITRRPGIGGAGKSRIHSGAAGSFSDLRVRNWRRYRYTVTAFDRAGNVRRTRISARPGPRLIAPQRGAVLTAPPLLRWTPIRGAGYYNVQLFRDGHKVLSAWPHRAKLQVGSTWRFAGRERTFRPGRYRWYVWPGFGRPADRGFGARMGPGRFTVPPGV